MAPQASRRFHEAGVGSRTGLRLSAVARDQDGFEDLEAFYKASQAALDQGQQTLADEENDDDENDYDSFDETHFSRRSSTGVNGKGRQAASSSSLMDIQNSSAPSPRSLLRSSRPSAISISSSVRKGKANVTLADDDYEDDLDLPDLSTGSRSFDLGAMGADDYEDYDKLPRAPPTPSAPAKGLSARQIAPKGKGKGKAASTGRRVDLSDSEDDDGILAHLQQRLNSAYDDDQDLDAQSDYDIVPVRASPAKSTANASAPKPRSPAKPAAKKRTAPVEEDRLPASQASRPKPPTSTSQQAQSPKRKIGRPPKGRAADPEPEAEPMYEDDHDEPEPEPEPEPAYLPPSSPSPAPEPAPPPKRKRGRPQKNRAAEEPTNDDFEVAQSSRPAPKSKSSANGTSRPAASTSKPKATKASKSSKNKRTAGEVVEKVRAPLPEATVFDENGVRRSTRQRFAPLEYWRGERIRYGRPSLPTGTTVDDLRRRPGEDEFEDDPSMMLMRKRVPVLDIKEVIRVPRAPGEGTFAGTTRPRTATSRRKIDRKSEDQTPRPPSRTPDPEGPWEVQLDPTADTVHPEDGWDVKTAELGLVIDDEDQTEVLTSIVRTRSSLQPLVAANQQFRFEKLFNCGGLMATGILQLPPGTRKPTKPSKDNSFVFCVLQGALRATVHRKSFIVGPEGVFQVPSGNTYSLENICERDVKLFFAQCRKTKKVSEGDITTFTQMSDTSHGTPQQMMMGVGRFGGRAGDSANLERKGEEEGSDEEGEESQAEQASGKNPRLGSVTHAKASRQIPAPTAAVPTLTADSDQEESEEDDFETSRQVKSKKRVFRKV
ncbi:related to inner kinetochore protein MIF2 [Ustilago trichophora]|uniref:CENP-C homolog n=1 Tax=Ustilago trichophora TaxID=86804 RepID=A0A5C3DR00_9BASI|nr:related to inner kinetochore protein MIF2 [Ustilago trichophora]